MILIKCKTKVEFIEVLRKAHKDGYLLGNSDIDVHHQQPYERYISLFPNKTFEWSSFPTESYYTMSATEYLSILGTKGML